MNYWHNDKASSAESREGRPLIKENAGQPNRYPTQSGKSVSQGLAGVRKAARENKEMKFTASLHHLTGDLLRVSFKLLLFKEESCARSRRGQRMLPRLHGFGVDIGAAVEVVLDAADTLATFMRNGMPDPVRSTKVFDQLIVTAAEATKARHPPVAIFGECVHLFCAQGNAEAAIQM
jgi:hypothetical protein